MRVSHTGAAFVGLLSLAACNQPASAPASGQADVGTSSNIPANGAAAAQAAQVSFRGCPILSDIDGGCLTVKSDDGIVYELYSAQPLPDPARNLLIEGTGETGTASTCMVGRPLNNVRWHYLKQSCEDKKE